MSANILSIKDIFSAPLEREVEKVEVKNKSNIIECLKQDPTKMKLKYNWILWHHSPFNKNWSINSFDKLYKIDTVNNFWYLINNWDECLPQVEQSMYFIMKQDILPLWEDKLNRNGGCWSIRIEKKIVRGVWNELCMSLVGGYITTNEIDYSLINGISISPKKTFCVIKIWCKENTSSIEKFISDKIKNCPLDSLLFKIHEESIDADKSKKELYMKRYSKS